MPAFDQRNQHVEQQTNVAGAYYAAPLTPISAVAPAPPGHFVGRTSDLAELEQQLTAGGTVAVTALQGMGGIGKTALARQLAATLAEHFSGGVFWGSLVDHDGRAQPILRTWGRTCAQDLAEEQDPVALTTLVRGLLAARQAEQGPLLVIVDDVRYAWLEGARLLQSAAPSGAPLLFTTREEGLAATLGAAIHRLNALAPGEAHTLLDSLVGDGVSTDAWEAATRLLHAVGYLPLAIELAAGRLKQLVRKPGFQLRDFTEAVMQRSQETLSLPGHPGLAATFAVTYDVLPPGQQQLFRWLGIFAPGSLALSHVAGLLQQEPVVVEHQLDELVSVAYLSYDQKQPGAYTLHPLLRDYAAQLLTTAGERDTAEQRHLAYFLAFAEVNQAKEPAVWDRLEAALSDLLLAVEAAVRRNEQPALRSFGHALVGNSEFLPMRGYNQAARAVLGHMLAACRVLADVEGEAVALGNLGAVTIDLGDHAAARSYLEQALEFYIRLGNPLGQANQLGNLGVVARDLGDYAAARSYLERALEFYIRLGNPLGQANQLGNLGVVAMNQGDYAAARAYHDQALELHTRLGSLLGQANQLGNLGLVTMEQGDHAAARSYHEQSLALYVRLGNPRGQANQLGNLGLVAMEQGDHAAARPYHEQALALYTRIGNPLGQADQLGNLGLVAMEQGDHAAARSYHEQALEIDTRLGNPRGQADDLANLGLLAINQGDYATARSYLQRSAALYQKLGLVVHPEVAQGLVHLSEQSNDSSDEQG